MKLNVNKQTNEFYEAASQSELMIQRCKDCGEYVFFPREYCPNDLGELEFVQASGKGRVVTFTVVVNDGQPVFKDLVPYVAAVVELEEGVRMYTRILIDDPREVTFNQEVEVVFESSPLLDGNKIPLFKPISNAN